MKPITRRTVNRVALFGLASLAASLALPSCAPLESIIRKSTKAAPICDNSNMPSGPKPAYGLIQKILPGADDYMKNALNNPLFYTTMNMASKGDVAALTAIALADKNGIGFTFLNGDEGIQSAHLSHIGTIPQPSYVVISADFLYPQRETKGAPYLFAPQSNEMGRLVDLLVSGFPEDKSFSCVYNDNTYLFTSRVVEVDKGLTGRLANYFQLRHF